MMERKKEQNTQRHVAREGIGVSVTRLGDLLHFGQHFKTCGNNYFAQIAHILGHFYKGVKIFHFTSEIILAKSYRPLATFYRSH